MTYNSKVNINIKSEIGKLEGVILHNPGAELENMTPSNAQKALYTDILNLAVSQSEYAQLAGVLNKLTKTYYVNNLLNDILKIENVRIDLINKICNQEHNNLIGKYLNELDSKTLAKEIIEGSLMGKDNLTNYLNSDRYSLKPLHNFFFTRDASISLYDKVLISKMTSSVRQRESLIMEAIFKNHPIFKAKTINQTDTEAVVSNNITIEGGDVLIAREDILLIGLGARTTSQGVDFIVENLKQNHKNMNILVQELPKTPESFIHLDMVFTLLDKNFCMIYQPIILQPNNFKTIHIEISNGKVQKISNKENLISGLNQLGMELEPLYCGGRKDRWQMDREQWHSGANFFAFAPGKVIGYERNKHTIDELNNAGFAVLKAADIIAGNVHPDDYEKCVVTILGSELPRGGGGARCMTMPINRKDVEW